MGKRRRNTTIIIIARALSKFTTQM